MLKTQANSQVNVATQKVVVIVLNWNGLSDTLECLASLEHCTYPHIEVVVVDNGSANSDAEIIAAAFPKVIVISNGKNLGWAGGNNVGIRYALSKDFHHIFLLNNDTTVEAVCIAALVAAAESLGCGLLHPAIYHYDEPDVPQLDPSAGQGTVSSEIYDINFAYGAALMISRSLIERVGLLDERFFLQLEETDYFKRSSELGFLSRVLPAARVLHKESRSFGGRRTPLKTYYSVRNSLLLASKHSKSIDEWKLELKRLYWSIEKIAANELDGSILSSVRLARWLFGRSVFSKAVRSGVYDFCFGRFGKASANRERQLYI